MPPKTNTTLSPNYSSAQNVQQFSQAKLPIVIDKKVARQFIDMYCNVCQQLQIVQLPCLQNVCKALKPIQEVLLFSQDLDFASTYAIQLALQEATDVQCLRILDCQFQDCCLHLLLQSFQYLDLCLVFDKCKISDSQLDIIVLLAAFAERKIQLKFFECSLSQQQMNQILEIAKFHCKGGIVGLCIQQDEINVEFLVEKIRQTNSGSLKMLQLFSKNLIKDQQSLLVPFHEKSSYQQILERAKRLYIRQNIFESSTNPDFQLPRSYYYQLTAYLKQTLFSLKHIPEMLLQFSSDLALITEQQKAEFLKIHCQSAQASAQSAKPNPRSKISKAEEPSIPFKLPNKYVVDVFLKQPFSLFYTFQEIVTFLDEFWSNINQQVDLDAAEKFLFDSVQTDRLLLKYLLKPNDGVFLFAQLDYLAISGDSVTVDSIGSLQAFQVGDDLTENQIIE